MSEKPIEPINLTERRAEIITKTKQAIAHKLDEYFTAKEITGVTLAWDEVEDYRTIRFSLRSAYEGEQLLDGNEFHLNLLAALGPAQFPELVDYELNPYGEVGFITFHKR